MDWPTSFYILTFPACNFVRARCDREVTQIARLIEAGLPFQWFLNGFGYRKLEIRCIETRRVALVLCYNETSNLHECVVL